MLRSPEGWANRDDLTGANRELPIFRGSSGDIPRYPSFGWVSRGSTYRDTQALVGYLGGIGRLGRVPPAGAELRAKRSLAKGSFDQKRKGSLGRGPLLPQRLKIGR